MGHKLRPKNNGPFLAPKEVVRRLRNDIKYVDASSARAAKSIDEGIKYMLEVRETGGGFTEEEIERLRSVRNKSIDIIIGDAAKPNAILSFVVEPGEELFIGYESGQHEDAAKPLLERIARALDYEIELV